MLFVDKKETFFDYNNKNFSKSQKSPFAKGLTHVLVKKMPIFFVYLFFEKFRLEVMLSDFAQEKETFLTLKNRIFPKGLTHAFDQKMPISSLFSFYQIKINNKFEFFDQKHGLTPKKRFLGLRKIFVIIVKKGFLFVYKKH